MKLKKKNKSIKDRVGLRISRSSKTVFLRENFLDLGGYDQVGRALGALAVERQITRIGYGVYAKMIKTRRGNSILANRGGFKGATREALNILGVVWEASRAEKDYNEGRTTQVPANSAIQIKQRFSRKMKYGSQELKVI